MPIRWSAVQVAEAMDEVEAFISQAEPFLQQALQKVRSARNIPRIPQYLDQRLCRIADEIERVSGGVLPYSGQSYPGTFKASISAVRNSIPEDALEIEKAQGRQQSLGLD